MKNRRINIIGMKVFLNIQPGTMISKLKFPVLFRALNFVSLSVHALQLRSCGIRFHAIPQDPRTRLRQLLSAAITPSLIQVRFNSFQHAPKLNFLLVRGGGGGASAFSCCRVGRSVAMIGKKRVPTPPPQHGNTYSDIWWSRYDLRSSRLLRCNQSKL